MSTVITTLDLSRRSEQLLDRVRKLLNSMVNNDCHVVIGHQNRATRYDKQLIALASEYPDGKLTLASNSTSSQLPCQARLRNLAINAANDEVVVFVDADIEPDPELFHSLAGKVAQQTEPFVIAPCIYTTGLGSRHLNDGQTNEEIFNSYLNYSRSLVSHLAIPSSVMAVSTNDIKEIGGFNEAYEGHGYEDFEFMVRLAAMHKMLDIDDGLLLDQTYVAPLLMAGFRAKLAQLCMPQLLDGLIAVHHYHERDNTENYYINRSINAKIFRENMQVLIDQDSETHNPKDNQELIDVFFSECRKRNLPPEKFHALFDARPVKNSFPVKIKKLAKRRIAKIRKRFRK